MLLLSFCPLPNVSVSSHLPSGDEGDNFYVIDQGEVDVSGRKELSHSHKKTTTYFLSLYIWPTEPNWGGGCNQQGGSRVELWENVDFPNSWRDEVALDCLHAYFAVVVVVCFFYSKPRFHSDDNLNTAL